MSPRWIALACFLLPVIAVHGSYAISLYEQTVPFCFPYTEGCVSISRAARNGNALFLFRAAMIAYAVLLVVYWHISILWIRSLLERQQLPLPRRVTLMYWLGFVGAVFLVLYADFLGVDGKVYRLLRRYGIVLFFAMTPVAQLIQMSILYRFATGIEELWRYRPWLHLQVSAGAMMLVLGVISLILDAMLLDDYEIENIIEWNFAILMALFYVGSYVIWSRMGLQLQLISSSGGEQK